MQVRVILNEHTHTVLSKIVEFDEYRKGFKLTRVSEYYDFMTGETYKFTYVEVEEDIIHMRCSDHEPVIKLLESLIKVIPQVKDDLDEYRALYKNGIYCLSIPLNELED